MSKNHQNFVLDQKARIAEKQASRDRDQRRLESGEITLEQLKAETAYFGDMKNLKIVAIGRRPVNIPQ